MRELIEQHWVDKDYVAAHTLGFDELAETVAPYNPEHVAETCGISASELRQPDTDRQLGWLRTRIKQSAPQALIAAR